MHPSLSSLERGVPYDSEQSENRYQKGGIGHFFRILGGQWQLMLMSIPMLAYVILFNYVPMWGWITAFQDDKPKLGVSGSAWVGLKNCQWLFGRADFINSIRNTLAMSVINLVFGTGPRFFWQFFSMRCVSGDLSVPSRP